MIIYDNEQTQNAFFLSFKWFCIYFLSILFKNHISRKLQYFGMIVINQRNWSGT